MHATRLMQVGGQFDTGGTGADDHHLIRPPRGLLGTILRASLSANLSAALGG